MERHVEARFERIEKNLEKSNERVDGFFQGLEETKEITEKLQTSSLIRSRKPSQI